MKNDLLSDLESIIEERTFALKLVIQQLTKSQEEVSNSLEKEREINEMKSRFVSMASHEFRSPLSSIQLSASLIEHYYDRLEADKIHHHLKKIKMSVNELTSILNDFLSIERIEQGNIKPVFNVFDLETFFNEVVDEMRLMTKKHQRIFYNHLGDHIFCYQDINLIKHCVINLISNAIKYSKEDGEIAIETEINDQSCRISIKDNGIGVPQEDQPHLFTPFYRATNTGSTPGTGLGLNIVDKYVRLMQGTINLESSLEKGTTFTLLFPLNDNIHPSP